VLESSGSASCWLAARELNHSVAISDANSSTASRATGQIDHAGSRDWERAAGTNRVGIGRRSPEARRRAQEHYEIPPSP